MAGQVRAIVLGLDYQARTFWIEACRLFFDREPVRHVSMEQRQIRAFDDVVSRYTAPVVDVHGRQIESEHFQNKFHVDFAREILGLDFVTPKLTNAKSVSIMRRVGQATRGRATPRRMTFLSPWRIQPQDALRQIVSAVNGEILIGKLFGGSADRPIRELREAWRHELDGISDDEMAEVLKHLRIWDGWDQTRLDERLDYHLFQAGLAPVDRTSAIHRYDALADAFLSRTGWTGHDRDALRIELERENLWIGRPPRTADDPDEIAIKSFERFAYQLEDEAKTLNLVPLFDGRQLRPSLTWRADVLQRVDEFLTASLSSSRGARLHLDTHLSIAFIAGAALQKAGVITPAQRLANGGRVDWPADEGVDGPGWDEVIVEIGDGPAVAVTLEATHPVIDDVADYLRRERPEVGRVVRLVASPKPTSQSILGGRHAHSLAAQAALRIRDERNVAAGPIHVFAAAPASLMFLVGRQSLPLGPVALYEFDPTAGIGAYSPSITLPEVPLS